jgi:hypothetical protein
MRTAVESGDRDSTRPVLESIPQFTSIVQGAASKRTDLGASLS